MYGTKSALASKGVWGGIGAAAAGIVGVVAVFAGLTPDQTAEVSQNVDTIIAGVAAAAGGVSGLLAIYGRIKAVKQIG